jgi:hypothetical protein
VLCWFATFEKIIVTSSSGSNSPTSPVTLLGLLDPENGALHSLRTSVTMHTMTQLHIPEDFNLHVQWLFETLFEVLCLQNSMQQIHDCSSNTLDLWVAGNCSSRAVIVEAGA